MCAFFFQKNEYVKDELYVLKFMYMYILGVLREWHHLFSVNPNYYIVEVNTAI